MTDTTGLKTTIKVCMFDQYGTVVDMQGGLTKIATPYLKAKGWAGSPNSFVTWWRRTAIENSLSDALLPKEHTPYREIGQRPDPLHIEEVERGSHAHFRLRGKESDKDELVE